MISVRVQPSGGRSRVVGVHGDSVRIRISAPANEGKANAELVRFVAETATVRKSAVEIVSGHRNRDKELRVNGSIDPFIAAVDEAS